MSTTPSAPGPVAVTVVRSSACHFCDEASAALADLGTEFPLSVEFVDCMAPRGAALIYEHRAGMYPLVLLDGAFFSAGRLPRKKLRARLAATFATVS